MVRGEQQDQLVGAHPRGRDPQRRILGQVERLRKLSLRQHFQPEPPGLLGKPGQVVLRPARPQIVTNHRIGIAVAVGLVSRAQDRVTHRDGFHRLPQPRDIDVAGDAIGDADIEQRAVGVD